MCQWLSLNMWQIQAGIYSSLFFFQIKNTFSKSHHLPSIFLFWISKISKYPLTTSLFYSEKSTQLHLDQSEEFAHTKAHSLSRQWLHDLHFWKRHPSLFKPFQASQSWHQLSFYENKILGQNCLLDEWILVLDCNRIWNFNLEWTLMVP